MPYHLLGHQGTLKMGVRLVFRKWLKLAPALCAKLHGEVSESGASPFGPELKIIFGVQFSPAWLAKLD